LRKNRARDGATTIDRSQELRRLSEGPVPKLPLSRADEIRHPQPERVSNHPGNVRVIPNQEIS